MDNILAPCGRQKTILKFVFDKSSLTIYNVGSMKVKVRQWVFWLGIIPVLGACPSAAPSREDTAALAISRAFYDKTFAEVLRFIETMETIVMERDFSAWKEQCTAGYLALYSDPRRLRELSQKPYLKDQRIVLHSLADYFFHVFIPSRRETKLKKIEFIEKNRVKAITVIDDVPYVVYFLEKDENNLWKIGVW